MKNLFLRGLDIRRGLRSIMITNFVAISMLFSAQHILAQVEISVNPALEYQEIDGFGASDAWRCQFVGKHWPIKKKERIAELLFSQEFDKSGNPLGIGLSLWRFYISAGSTEQGENSGIPNEWRRGESFIDSNGNFNWKKQAGQQWFLRKAKDAGVEKLLAFSIAPPVFWSFNQKGYNSQTGGVLNLKPAFYDDYADFLTNVLEHFEKEGLTFHYLSPVNESQWDWERATQEGTPASNENITHLVRILNDGIQEKKLSTQIIIPEAADLRFLISKHDKPKREDQINAFFGKPGINDTNIRGLSHVYKTVSGHSYFTTWPLDTLITVREKLEKVLTNHNVDYWQSEFCILEKTNDTGKPAIRDLGMNTALYVARVIHADLCIANAKSWQWWTALTIADYKDGLIYLDTGKKEDLYNRDALKYDGEFHDSKLLWALGNYARFVRPGMIRIHAEIDKDLSLMEQYKDLMVSAFKDPHSDKIILIAINYSDHKQSIKIDKAKIFAESAYETSDNKNLKKIQLHNNQIELEARSVVTISSRLVNH